MNLIQQNDSFSCCIRKALLSTALYFLWHITLYLSYNSTNILFYITFPKPKHQPTLLSKLIVDFFIPLHIACKFFSPPLLDATSSPGLSCWPLAIFDSTFCNNRRKPGFKTAVSNWLQNDMDNIVNFGECDTIKSRQRN